MTAEDARPASFRWDRLTVALTLGYCMLVAGLSVGVVLGELRNEFGINGVVTALHGSSFGVGLLVFGVSGVRMVHRFGRRRVLEAAMLLLLAGVTLFVTGPSWPVTLVGTVLSGFGSALVVLVMPGLVSDHHGEHRAAAFAAVNGVPGLLGITFGVAIGTVVRGGGSWRPVYLGLTVLIAIALVIVALPVDVPDGVQADDAEPFSWRGLLDRSVFVPWWPLVNGTLCEFTVGVWGVAYLKEVGGASSGDAAILASVFAVMMTTVRLNVGPLVRRLGAHALAAAFAVIALGAALMCFGPGLWPKVVGLGLAGLGGGPLYPLAVDRLYARTEHRLDSVTLSSYCALGSGTAIVVGPLALGALSDGFGLRWAILAVTALALLGIVTQRASARPAT